MEILTWYCMGLLDSSAHVQKKDLRAANKSIAERQLLYILDYAKLLDLNKLLANCSTA